ncbi:MAG TPA: hypothetical protein VLI39_09990 [Sedimentisphaerales bacterium]|nr:hypothetical protein [Sedimentisphaerales bacterium]
MNQFGAVILSVCVAAIMSVAAPAQAGLTYDGTLSVADGGLIATDKWNAAGTKLSWIVSNEVTPGLWHYSYTLTVLSPRLTVPSPAISHVIVEVSDGDPGPAFTISNLLSPTSNPLNWIAGPIEIQTYNPGPGNPGMPATVYGVKFNAADDMDAKILTLEFDSDRVPVWGDLYAKGGSKSALFNAGFAADDPTVPAASGSYESHLLVPDTMTVVIPAPGALLLCGLGTGLLGWLRRRKAV